MYDAISITVQNVIACNRYWAPWAWVWVNTEHIALCMLSSWLKNLITWKMTPIYFCYGVSIQYSIALLNVYCFLFRSIWLSMVVVMVMVMVMVFALTPLSTAKDLIFISTLFADHIYPNNFFLHSMRCPFSSLISHFSFPFPFSFYSIECVSFVAVLVCHSI